jgi:hypothetical protein
LWFTSGCCARSYERSAASKKEKGRDLEDLTIDVSHLLRVRLGDPLVRLDPLSDLLDEGLDPLLKLVSLLRHHSPLNGGARHFTDSLRTPTCKCIKPLMPGHPEKLEAAGLPRCFEQPRRAASATHFRTSKALKL